METGCSLLFWNKNIWCVNGHLSQLPNHELESERSSLCIARPLNFNIKSNPHCRSLWPRTNHLDGIIIYLENFPPYLEINFFFPPGELIKWLFRAQLQISLHHIESAFSKHMHQMVSEQTVGGLNVLLWGWDFRDVTQNTWTLWIKYSWNG